MPEAGGRVGGAAAAGQLANRHPQPARGEEPPGSVGDFHRPGAAAAASAAAAAATAAAGGARHAQAQRLSCPDAYMVGRRRRRGGHAGSRSTAAAVRGQVRLRMRFPAYALP